MTINRIRNRAWHYVTPAVAACAGMTLCDLQQFCAGSFTPSDDQLERLAQRMRMMEVTR